MTTQQESLRTWLICCFFLVAFIASIQPYYSVLSTTTTNTSSSSCSTRGWLSDLQQEAITLQNTVSKLEKAVGVLNTTNTNSTSQIIAMRVSQLKKVKTALNNLNLEIQVISDRCNNYDGDDCNITRALNITGEFMYFSFDNGDLADKYGIPTESYGMSFSDASPRKPYYGKYAVFNKATSSNFNTNSPTWVTFGTGKSLSLWLRKLTNTDSGVVWSFLMSQPPLFQHMGSNGLASSDNLEFYWKTSSTLPIRFYSSSKLLDNEWHHLAVVCKATGVDIYIDGVLDNSSSSAFDPVTSNIKFGGLQGINSAFFSGHMDEIRMFNVELTAAQIQQIFNY